MSEPKLSYEQASARGTTPIGQVVSLFDTILRDLARAVAALRVGDIETRVAELNHALLVIAHLENVLNHETGEEAAKHFERFYSVTRGMIVQGNFQGTPGALEEIIKLYAGMRQAWYQAEQQQSPGGQAQAPPADQPNVKDGAPAVNPAPDDDKPERNWNA